MIQFSYFFSFFRFFWLIESFFFSVLWIRADDKLRELNKGIGEEFSALLLLFGKKNEKKKILFFFFPFSLSRKRSESLSKKDEEEERKGEFVKRFEKSKKKGNWENEVKRKMPLENFFFFFQRWMKELVW